MNIIICCTLIPAEYEMRIPQISNAANRFLLNLIKELEKEHTVRVASFIGIRIDKEIIEELKGKKGIIKYAFRSPFIVKGFLDYRKILKSEIRNSDIVISYNILYPWIGIHKCIVNRQKSIMLLADYMPADGEKGIIRKMYSWLQKREFSKYDKFVALSDKAKDLVTNGQEYVVVEGGIDREFYNSFADYKMSTSGNTIFMYSGLFSRITGVDILLKAFSKCKNESIRLYISGKGELKNIVEDYASKDERVKYLGCAPYEEYLEYLSLADVFINPRNMDFIDNRYNFPSKVMEYLATGRRVISTKFSGWERFKDNIEFCENGVDGIRQSIEKMIGTDVQNKEEWINQREFAKKFLWENQIKKIL